METSTTLGNLNQLAPRWSLIFYDLVGGWTNPVEKYARQNGNLPQVGVKIKHIWNHHLVMWWRRFKQWWCGSFAPKKTNLDTASWKMVMYLSLNIPKNTSLRRRYLTIDVLDFQFEPWPDAEKALFQHLRWFLTQPHDSFLRSFDWNKSLKKHTEMPNN